MAQLHFVKKARKDHPAGNIKKGEHYWWWAFMRGGRGGPRIYSKVKPRRSQLTQSDFLGAVYDIEDRLDDVDGVQGESLADERDDIASDIRALGEEQQDKLDNMPESLQQGQTGELLQSRIDACEEWAGEVEGVECDGLDDKEDGESDEDFEDRLSNAAGELRDCAYSGK